MKKLKLLFLILALDGVLSQIDPMFHVVSTTEGPNEKDALIASLSARLEYFSKIDSRMNMIENRYAQLQMSLENERNIDQMGNKLDSQVDSRCNILEFTQLQNLINKQNEKLEQMEERISKIENTTITLNETFEIKAKTERTNQQIQEKVLIKNCKQATVSGIYSVQPKSETFDVFCDMETKGGGWIVIQRRFNGSLDFDKKWEEYKEGFGNLEAEFWLGLERIYQLTDAQLSELYVELVNENGRKFHAFYHTFKIGSEEEDYILKVLNGYKGTAGDSLGVHVGDKFSTVDEDHDNYSKNCAAAHGGGWWFDNCNDSNLNGRYLKSGQVESGSSGVNWHAITSYSKSLSQTKMMIRPKE